MPTFQAVIYSLIYSLSEVLPVSAEAHLWAMSFFFHEWTAPSDILMGGFSFGTALAVLVYFRHDWITALASFLQVTLYFKKPMTLDERMLFFIVASTLPTIAAWYYFREMLEGMEIEPLWIAGGLVLFSLPLWASDSLNRKAKGSLDWNLVDSIILGFTQTLFLIPGAGRQIGALSGAFLRNYNREAAIKFVFLTFLPILVIKASIGLQGLDFSQPSADPEVSWLTFFTSVFVCFFTSMLAIGGLMKNIAQRRWGKFIAWRFLLAGAIAGVVWMRNQ